MNDQMSDIYELKLLITQNDKAVAGATGYSDSLQAIIATARAVLNTCEEQAEKEAEHE